MAKYEFPSNLYEERNGHYMRITSKPPRLAGSIGSGYTEDTFILPMPVEKESYLYKQQHTYADVKLSRASSDMTVS